MKQADARTNYFDLISGRARGFWPSCLRAFLACGEFEYRSFMAARALYYKFAARRVELPVISVGNLTVGGTGKTPLVAWLARRLVEMGHRPVIVSRGYKRQGSGPGDEAAALRAELPETVGQVESPDRYRALRKIITEKAYDVAILDDGFQHIQLRRDLDIVTIDATQQPIGYGHLIPRGLLREPLSALRRAQVVVITRSDQVVAENLRTVESQILRHTAPQITLLHSVHAPVRFLGPDGRSEPLEVARGRKVYAFCGLANPAAFYQTLESLGATVVAHRDFADHYAYTREDIAELLAAAREAGAERLVTTTKDWPKVLAAGRAELAAARTPLTALCVEIEFIEGQEKLDGILKRLVGVVAK